MYKLASLAIVVAMTGTVYAQSQAEIAAQLNEEGKELMYADKFDEAAKKFAEAVARVPEAKYFVNLCAAQLQVGKLNEALTACNAVELNSPSPDQRDRAKKLLTKIREEAQKQGVQLVEDGGGCSPPGPCTSNPIGQKPNNPNAINDPTVTTPPPPGPGPDNRPRVGRPLNQSLVAAGPPDHRYTWTLGVDLFGGGGQIGKADYYGTVGGGLRIKGDYLLDPTRRLGVEAYFQLSHLGRGNEDLVDVDTLEIFDLGFAGYKHFCPGGTPRLCFTPLVGAHLALMSPGVDGMDEYGSQVFNYAGIGGRAELSMEVAFGRRYEHVLAVMVGANLYSPVLSNSGEFTPQSIGLDVGGALGYVGFGYTYRFNSPLGSAPFVILE